MPTKKTAKKKVIVKKAVKKVASKKIIKKATPKKVAKKTAPKQTIKKAVKKVAVKKATKKVTAKKAVKKVAPKKVAKKTAPKKTIKKAVKKVAVKKTTLKKPVVKPAIQTHIKKIVHKAPVAQKESDVLTEKEIQEIKEELLALREDAQQRLKNTKSMDMPEVEVGDDIDNASKSLDKEILFELSGNAHNTIEQIEAALRKMDKGIYGICEYCRRPIPKKRMKALPFARYCINCQHTNEHHRS